MKRSKSALCLSALSFGALLVLAPGCSEDEPKSSETRRAELEAKALGDVKTYVNENLEALTSAATALQEAAPVPDADGWNATADAAAVATMKSEWKKARIAYERIEGAIAVLFPELDAATDERYDGFVSTEKDENLFDGEGVTGIHGIERILWADAIPEGITAREKAIVGSDNFVAAAFPANEAQASDFKQGLLGRFIADVQKMRDDFAPLALDPAAAFRGVIGSVEEQLEKASLAQADDGAEESRYAQFTLADMRANIEGGKAIFDAFRPWLEQVQATSELAAVDAGFARIQAEYDAIEGDALPPVPETWSSVDPSSADLQTPFGQLFAVLSAESDPALPESTVSQMNLAADKLGIPQLPAE